MDDADAREQVTILRATDDAIHHLGVDVVAVSAGSVELALTVKPTMVNGHRVLHGGYLFLLADTAFAYCCASVGRASVTRTADIAFLASASIGTRITAIAEVRVAQARATICDVRIEADGVCLAEFRGQGLLTG